MGKAGGYILSILGLLLLAVSINDIKKLFLKYIPQLATIQNMYLMIVGIVLVIFGIVMLKGSSRGRVSEEVPIYRGNRIVGYRRGR